MSEAGLPFLELRAGASLAAIRPLSELLGVALRALGADAAAQHDLSLAVAELVSNLQQHEYGGGEGEVGVRLVKEAAALRLEVRSGGPAFDLQGALAQAAASPEGFQGHGLGLPLLVGLFDSIACHQEAGQNCFVLRKLDA